MPLPINKSHTHTHTHTHTYIYIYIPRAHTRCVLYTVEFNQISPIGGLILLESEAYEG
jgi:hypothetical protein